MKVKHGIASEQSKRSASLKVTVSLQRMQCPSLCPAVRFQQQFLAVKVPEPWHVFPVHHNERWCKRKPYCCQSHHLAASCIVALTVGRTVKTNVPRTLCTGQPQAVKFQTWGLDGFRSSPETWVLDGFEKGDKRAVGLTDGCEPIVFKS